MASTDIQPLLDSQPPALSPNVPRVKADGMPTTHLIDWEFYQTDWFKSNIIATDTRIDEVKAVAEGASAAVQDETNARVSADEALAERITTVEATVDDSTANGEIYFAAMAGPAGSVAAYGIFLKAGNAFTGLQMIAKSGGGSAIGLTANQLTFTDSGTSQPVFNYSSGLFTFNVPIRVGTNDIGLQSINAPAITEGTDVVQINSTGGAWVPLMSVTNTGGPGMVAVVHVDFEYYVDGAANAGYQGFRITRNDGKILYDGNLIIVQSPRPIALTRLDTDFHSAFTYSLELNFTLVGPNGSAPKMIFNNRRSIMIDLRKR